MRVLVVDDERPVARLIASWVVELGHSCDMILDPREAMPLIRQNNYDVVLLDVMMPYLDGFELLKLIQFEEGLAQPKTALMTAHAKAVKEEGRQFTYNPTDYLMKPLPKEDLVEFLASCAVTP